MRHLAATLFALILCSESSAAVVGRLSPSTSIQQGFKPAQNSIYGKSLTQLFTELAQTLGLKGPSASDWKTIFSAADETMRRTDDATRARIKRLQSEIIEEARRMGSAIDSVVPPGGTSAATTTPPLMVNPDLVAQRNAWVGVFSDPKTHNPNEFTYLVHVISGDAGEVAHFLTVDTATSASLITSQQPAVVGHGTFGFILNPGQIEVASPVDLGLENSGMRQLTEEMRQTHYEHLRGEEGLLPPNRVLEKTPPGQHNEVIVSSAPSHPTTVAGLFVIEYRAPDGTTQLLVTPEELAQLQAYAAEHDIPIVRIPYTDPEAY